MCLDVRTLDPKEARDTCHNHTRTRKKNTEGRKWLVLVLFSICLSNQVEAGDKKEDAYNKPKTLEFRTRPTVASSVFARDCSVGVDSVPYSTVLSLLRITRRTMARTHREEATLTMQEQH